MLSLGGIQHFIEAKLGVKLHSPMAFAHHYSELKTDIKKPLKVSAQSISLAGADDYGAGHRKELFPGLFATRTR